MSLRSKNVLVTGADGFIGSHLVEHLVASGFKVRAMVYYNSLGSWGWLDSIDPHLLSEVDVVAGDVRDTDGVDAACEGMDLIFHLAALIGIPYSYTSPRSYVDTNTIGTLNVLQASRRHAAERVLVTSTSEVYGTALRVPIDETHPLQAQSPYAASKIAADRLAESFHKSFDLPVVIVRPFNTYGPRQSARAVIPTIISQLVGGAEEINLGNTKPTRDFNFVSDTVAGFRELAVADGVIGEEINIATQQEVSIGQLANELIAQINPSARIVEDAQRLRPDNSEVERLLGSNGKIRRMTKWLPSHTLDEGLAETIEWFRNPENLKLYKTGIYNV